MKNLTVNLVVLYNCMRNKVMSFYDRVGPNYSRFIDELTVISKKYGVAVYGHFDITENPEEFANIQYDRDVTSSDIRSYNYWDE